MVNMMPQDDRWQKPIPAVAKRRSYIGFRQWRFSTLAGESPRDFGTAKTRPKFTDDFTLRSLAASYNWVPTGNTVHCTSVKAAHAIPGFHCTCGLYCSYSSSIIYDPAKLGRRLYCFGAISVPAVGSVFCEFGIRATTADVVGILFHPADEQNTTVQSLMRRLDAEFIPHTFSAREFLKEFPDQDVSREISFDPVRRLSEFKYIYEGRENWSEQNFDEEFARPLSPEMLQAESLGEYLAISVKPDYRPGGRYYEHPLFKYWPE